LGFSTCYQFSEEKQHQVLEELATTIKGKTTDLLKAAGPKAHFVADRIKRLFEIDVQKSIQHHGFLHSWDTGTKHADMVGQHPASINDVVDRYESTVGKPDQIHRTDRDHPYAGSESKMVLDDHIIKEPSRPEFVTQKLYHTMGIGDLCQKSHVTRTQVIDGNNHKMPRTLHIIHMEPDHITFDCFMQQKGDVWGAGHNHHDDYAKIGIMDHITKQIDRHGGNIMVGPTSKPLAIDNSMAFGLDFFDTNSDAMKEATHDFKKPISKEVVQWWHRNKHHIVPVVKEHLPHDVENTKRRIVAMDKVIARLTAPDGSAMLSAKDLGEVK
jgi:hypothetical protein